MPKSHIGDLSITTKGFGFVAVDDGPDIFVERDHLSTAMDGDTVEVTLSRKGRRPRGTVTRIVKRGGKPIVGRYRRKGQGGIVYPDGDRILSALRIPVDAKDKRGKTGAKTADVRPKTGDIVVAVLEEWTAKEQEPVGRVVDILGRQGDPGVAIKITAVEAGLPLEFPKEIVAAAKKAASGAPQGPGAATGGKGTSGGAGATEHADRRDLRNLATFTIDPETARDFDDALSVQPLDDGRFQVGVHIADVDAFVEAGGVVDREARRRGTSTYFVGDSIPMIPEVLSGDACSLREGIDRFAVSVIIIADAVGRVHEFEIVPSVIRSAGRLTYAEAQAALEGGGGTGARSLSLLQMLTAAFKRRRLEAGSIDFDFPETVIEVDKNGVPRTVTPVERGEAQEMVAEAMLVANRLVALFGAEVLGVPFVYRVHPEPSAEDVGSLRDALESLGIPYKLDEQARPEDYRNVLALIQNLEFRDFVERVAIGSMAKAHYSTENDGHFGLAFRHYTHFTSPIRRYPDLVVHRILKATIGKGVRLAFEAPGEFARIKVVEGQSRRSRSRRRGKAPRRSETAIRSPYKGEELASICAEADAAERRSVTAERAYHKEKSLEFLSKKIGNTYEGVVSGVVSFGLFVQISRYLIEGLVPIAELPGGRYVVDEDGFALREQGGKREFRLGDRVEVRIKRVSLEDRHADFELVSDSA